MDKVIKQTGRRFRQWKQWLARRVHNLTARQRIICASVAGVLLLAAVIPTVQYFIESRRHTLDDATLALVGKSNPNLAAKLTYDRQNSQWQFNKTAITDTSRKSTNPAEDIPPALKAQIGGSGEKDESLYAINFPTDPKKGVTFYDTQTGLSFTMTPQFKVHGGKATKDNRIVYPMAGGAQLIYTPKNNGMKEDIVLPKFIGKELAYSYKLDLPSTLSARVQADGSVGVFSIDPSLLGNVSTSSDADAEKLKSARENAEKNHLLFAIPAPVIAQTGGKKIKATARFGLADGVLTVTARDMDTVQYPASIDPSVVVTSSSDFKLDSNDDGMIDYSTDGQIRLGATTGGTTGSWATTTSFSSALGNNRTSMGFAIYNGYMYIVGGSGGGGTFQQTSAYAPINSDGTVGTWQTTTSLPVTLAAHELVIYNGYAYVTGGLTSGNNDFVNTTYYARVNSNGGLGSWTTGPAFTGVRSGHGSVAVNGYLYVSGGEYDWYSQNQSSTYYAKINANGGLGSWTATTSLPSGRANFAMVASGNTIYFIGGNDTSGTMYNTVLRATAQSDGSLSAMSTDTPLPATRSPTNDGAFVYRGYLYVLGGLTSSGVTQDVLYAPLNANGTVGKWATTTQFTAPTRAWHSTGVYNGYMYVVGGDSGWQPSGAILYNDIQYSKISDAGATTAFATSGNTFPATRRGAQTVVYNGYLYVMGGDNGGTPVNTIYYASIGADGTIGSFTTATNPFTTVRTYFAAVAHNGYMYVIGGCSSAYSSCTAAANNLNTIYRSPLNASTGAPGAWINTNTTVLPAARYGISAVVYNNYLYVMGGLNGSTFSNAIYFHAIDPGGSTSDGRLSGAWTTSSRTLPASMAYMQAVTFGSRLYVAGGCSAGALTCTTTRNTVHYAGFNTNGELSAALAATATFTTARGDFGLAAVNGRLYLTGGRTNTTYYNDTQSATINTDGTVASWSSNTDTTLATARYGIGMAAANSNLYVTGGYNGSTYYSNVQIATVNNGGSGTIGSWTEDTVGTLATARQESQTVAYNGYLYVLGGRNSGGTALNSVEYAPINSDGTVGTWQTTSSFSNGRVTFAAAAMNDYMYVLGGRNSGSYYKDIQYAKINLDGSLDTWASAGSNVYNGGQGVCMVAHGGYIYSLGGWDNSIDHVSVRYALQNANGTIGSWQTAPDFTGARSNIQCLAYGGYLYMSGGEDSVGKNDVQYASINSSNGSIGAWAFTTGYNLGRANHGMVAYNGYMYVMGGVNSTTSNTPRNDAQYAPINPNGTLGTWQHTTSPGGYYYADIVVYNGYIYLPTQYDGTFRATTRFAPIQTIPRVGRYSKFIDIGVLNKITGVTYGGTLAGGTKQIDYRTAGADGIFGATYNVGRPPSPEGPCLGTYGSGRYVWLSLTLDDTSGINSVITDITTIYESFHPAADIRLHGGRTLQNGTLSALDTCDAYT